MSLIPALHATAAATAASAAVALAWWLRRGLVAVSVSGASMAPTFQPGDRVLVRRATVAAVRRGDVVVVAVAKPPGDRQAPESAQALRVPPTRALRSVPWLIKRVVAVPGDPIPRDTVPALAAASGTCVPQGRLVVLGDNLAASSDSRHIGYLDASGLLGVVIRRLPRHPPERPGSAAARRRLTRCNERDL